MKRKRNAVPLTRVGGHWVLRPRLEVIENGERKTVQRAIKLIAADGRSKRPSQDVLDLAAEELRRLKGKPASPIKNLRVGEFFDTVFLPRVRENLRPSTATGYANAWAWYVQPAALARMWLREVRTCDVQDLLDGVARTHHISTTTLAHTKSLLSGVFREAAKLGYIGKEGNPVRETSVPGFAPKGRETKAYSSEEVARMLDVLAADPLALTLTAVAAYSGLRAGEIRGLRWESYQPSDDGSLPVLKVERSIWRRFESDPKTAMSKAAVPVIPQLASLLDTWRKRCGNPNTGTIFNNAAGRPVSLDSLHWRRMKPIFAKAGIEWHGWHGFRRGLATNLNRLGVDDSVIQRIMRHSSLAVTQRCYIKTDGTDAESAMRQLSGKLSGACSQPVLKNAVSGPSVTVQ